MEQHGAWPQWAANWVWFSSVKANSTCLCSWLGRNERRGTKTPGHPSCLHFDEPGFVWNWLYHRPLPCCQHEGSKWGLKRLPWNSFSVGDTLILKSEWRNGTLMSSTRQRRNLCEFGKRILLVGIPLMTTFFPYNFTLYEGLRLCKSLMRPDSRTITPDHSPDSISAAAAQNMLALTRFLM